MIALSYGYFHYKFNKFKFLDFKEITLYTKEDVFTPDKQQYALVFYSSKKDNLEKLVKKIKTDEYPVVAIDFSQINREEKENYVSITGGFNQLLKVINRLHLEHLPSIMIIKKEKKLIYKQDSRIEML